ncbi:MAG: hypothetical protein ACRCZS_01620 [Chroococcidiopsis sp.]
MQELITIESIVFTTGQTLIVKVSIALSGQPTRSEAIVVTGWDRNWSFDQIIRMLQDRYHQRSPYVSIFGAP